MIAFKTVNKYIPAIIAGIGFGLATIEFAKELKKLR